MLVARPARDGVRLRPKFALRKRAKMLRRGRGIHLRSLHLQGALFVLSQTEGKEYQAPVIPERNEQKALEALNIQRVEFEHLDGNTQGYAKRGGKIAVSPIAALPHKTLFHEIARLRQAHDASAASLHAFVEEAIQPGSVVHTDGWEGYAGLEAKGYIHPVTVLRRSQQSPAELLPRVHRVISLLKRWLLGTHQGAVSLAHLDYYLDEFTFRFNRRKSRSRGKLFYRLLQQAMAVEPAPYKALVGGTLAKPRNPNT